MALSQEYHTPISHPTKDFQTWTKERKCIRFIDARGKEGNLKSLPVYLKRSTVNDSEIVYDTHTGALKAFSTNEEGFWSLLNSFGWRTTVRVSKGNLLNRLLNGLQCLLGQGVVKFFETLQIYTKYDVETQPKGLWIPFHRVNERSDRQGNMERKIRVSRKYFALSGRDAYKHGRSADAMVLDDTRAPIFTCIQREPRSNSKPVPPQGNNKQSEEQDFGENLQTFRVVSNAEFTDDFVAIMRTLTVCVESVTDSKSWSSTVFVSFERRKTRLLVSL